MQRILITGGSGVVGTEFQRQIPLTPGYEDAVMAAPKIDVTDRGQVLEAFNSFRPTLVFHLAAKTAVDWCEENQEACNAVNVEGTRNVARAAQEAGAVLVYPSTFYVYSGDSERPFDERFDMPDFNQIKGVYSQSKFLGEQEVMASGLEKFFIVRLGALFGGGEKDTKFVAKVLTLIQNGKKTLKMVNDRRIQPSSVSDTVRNLLALAKTSFYGVYNLVGHGSASYYEYALEIVKNLGLTDVVEVLPINSSQFKEKAPRAKNLSAVNGRLNEIGLDLMQDWKDSLSDYLVEVQADRQVGAISSEAKPCKKVTTKGRSGQPNGFLVEVVSSKDNWTENIQGQVYMTTVLPGVFKGFHIHQKKVDHFTCLKGNVFIVTYENGEYKEYRSGEDGFYTVKIPPTVPHGLYNYGEEEAYVVNYCWPPYDPADPDQTEWEGEYVPSVKAKLSPGLAVREVGSREEIKEELSRLAGTFKEETRKEIKQLVQEFFDPALPNTPFVPGETLVQYAGSVHDDKEVTSMVDTLLDGWWGLGKKAREFESSLAEYVGAKKAVLTNSGSSASLLALASLKSPLFLGECLMEGDEVITPACTFPTTLNPIIQLGLRPVFLDIELGTYNINPADLEKALSTKTRALVLPHTLGNPNDMEAVMEFSREHNLFVIEDNCDALGSEFDGQKTGSFGVLSTLSFYPAHHITTGEGGAVLINDERFERPIRSLRDWGRACYCFGDQKSSLGECGKRLDFKVNGVSYDHRYMYADIGYNLKPIEVQAAMGVEQLKKFPRFKRLRKQNFDTLFEFLSKYRHFFILPHSHPKADPCWFSFPITVGEGAPFSKQELVQFLEERKIQTRPVFAGNILHHEPYKNIKCRIIGDLKNSDYVLENTFFVGVYPGLDDVRMAYILSVFDEFFKSKV